jgi:hypothetical protein
MPSCAGKTGRAVVIQAANAFVGEIDRNAETRLLDEPALDLIDRIRMHGMRVGESAFRNLQTGAAAIDAIQVFIDVADAVFPDRAFPFCGWQFVRKHARVAVQRRKLTRLLVERHLRQQVVDALIDGDRRILVGILRAVLIEVDPSGAVDAGSAGLQQQGSEG